MSQVGDRESAAERDFPALAAALAGQYELERELGRGGMGVVLLARDLKLHRPVAIKTLLPHLAHDERVRERFLREARTAASLTHPGIVPIHRADEVGGQVFFVMGFVDGESLGQRVRERGPLPVPEVIRLLRETADALGAAHARGVVHRDVKAENILLERPGGRAVVTDFGIARLAEAAPLTATGLVLGTVYYMSPEQVSGEPLDGRSDIYSLGVVGFLALSGRFPFESELASAVLVSQVMKAPPKLADVAPGTPPALCALIDRCLAKSPADRFASCAELSVALGAALAEAAGSLTSAPPVQSPARRSGVLVSESEAQRVWERASQLQAEPNSPPTAPDPSGRRGAPSASSAYPVEVVRDSAREAGIPTQYVDRALAERGLAEARGRPVPDESMRGGVPVVPASPGAAPMMNVVRDSRIEPASAFTGQRPSIDFELTVDGELPVSEYDWVIETIRRSLGDVGTVSVVGRSLTWSSADPQRKVHVTVQVRGGRTIVRVAERLSQLAGGTFGGLMGGLGGGVGFATFGILGGIAHSFPLGVAACAAVIGSSYLGARLIYGRVVRDREKTLHGLAERLGEEVRASIAQGK